ncbi:MAG: hypothetical protein AB1775_14905 [Bacteroidota bacterium]
MNLPYEPLSERNESDYWKQLANATSCKNSEDLVFWTIISVFTAAHTILIATLVTAFASTNYPVLIGLSLFALNLAIVQRLVQQRALGHLKMYEGLIANLEKRLRMPSDFALSGHYAGERWDKYLKKGSRARTVISYYMICLILLWFGIFIYSVAKWIFNSQA